MAVSVQLVTARLGSGTWDDGERDETAGTGSPATRPKTATRRRERRGKEKTGNATACVRHPCEITFSSAGVKSSGEL